MARQRAIPAGTVAERVRQNIRILKAHRRVSNYALADGGGWTNRQIIDNRLIGRTAIDMDDLERLAAGLRVEPHVLLLRSDEALRWVDDNPDYQPPRLAKQEPSAVMSDIMKERRKQREAKR
jgi:hypothetical protein